MEQSAIIVSLNGQKVRYPSRYFLMMSIISEETGLRPAPVDPSLTLKELREIFLEHTVFRENNTKLEEQAKNIQT